LPLRQNLEPWYANVAMFDLERCARLVLSFALAATVPLAGWTSACGKVTTVEPEGEAGAEGDAAGGEASSTGGEASSAGGQANGTGGQASSTGGRVTSTGGVTGLGGQTPGPPQGAGFAGQPANGGRNTGGGGGVAGGPNCCSRDWVSARNCFSDGRLYTCSAQPSPGCSGEGLYSYTWVAQDCPNGCVRQDDDAFCQP
jgi:hypothetical protein